MPAGTDDPRFAALAKDPRFARFPKKQNKVNIDKRFKGAPDMNFNCWPVCLDAQTRGHTLLSQHAVCFWQASLASHTRPTCPGNGSYLCAQ